MPNQKEYFLQQQLIPLLQTLTPKSHNRWGKMNAQQMIEHLTDFFNLSNGQLSIPLVTPEERLPRYLEFLRSELPFKENTAAPVLPAEPPPVKYPGLPAALQQLESAIHGFFQHFNQHPDCSELHPVFGWLNFSDWVQLHHKHVTHHLKQFQLLP